MKKWYLLLLAIVALSGCSSDDDATLGSGKLTVNGMSKTLRYGYIQLPYTGTNSIYDKRQFVVYLSDKPMKSITVDAFHFAENEQAHVALNFYAAVSQTGSLQQGSYPVFRSISGVTPDDAYLEQSTFAVSNYDSSGSVTESASTSTYAMQQGSAVFHLEDGTYDITFSGNGTGNNNVSGHYKGKLTVVDNGR